MMLSADGGPRVNCVSPLDQLFMINDDGLTDAVLSARGDLLRSSIGCCETYET
jgi:hypothetical protein